MTKKILIALFVLLVGVLFIFSYNFYKNIKAPISTNTLSAIPQNAALIIQESNFNAFFTKINSSSIIWEELVANTSINNNINNQLHFFDSIIQQPKIKLLLNNQPFTSSIHLAGAKNFNFIFYIPTVTEIDESTLIQEIKNITKSNPSNREYENVMIYTFPTNNQQKIALIYYKNIVAFSYSTILIEDVIRQLNAENSLLDNPSFQKVLSTSGQVEDGNLFINHQFFPKLSSLILNNSNKEYLKDLNNYANWSALDLQIKNNSLILNGFTLASDSANYYLSTIKDQKAQDQNLLEVVPDNVAFLFYYGVSNLKEFSKNKKDFLKSKNDFFEYQKYLDDQNEKYGIDWEEELLSNLENEIAFVITEPLTEKLPDEKFIILKSKDIEKSINNLSSIQKKISQNEQATIVYNDFEINKLEVTKVFSHLFGKPFYNLEYPFYTAIKDYLIFANSEESIKRFINKFSSEKTLKNDENFQSFSDYLSSSSNIFIYNNIARSINLYPHFLSEEYTKDVEEKIDLLRKFEAIAIQINTSKNDLYYNNIFLKYNPVYKQDTRTVWETKLDSTISSKPEIVVNHTNNTKEIFIQDDGNKVYLISNTGKIIWTKQLHEKIMGKVHQIDVYKNNKLQYLFNTKSKIYLIDRNGNNVEKFPVKLPHNASNGITQLDYDKNKNYRLLIGCENNMVYNYSTSGDLVKGWEYQTGTSSANSNIWHFAISGKDYIVIPLKNGEVRIVERSGKERIKLSNKLVENAKNINLKTNTELKNIYLVASDSAGNITKLYFNNKVEHINIENIDQNSYFESVNINSDNQNEYIFSSNNSVKAFDTEKKLLFNIKLNDSVIAPTQFFQLPDKSKKIGVVTSNNIYLYSENGILEEDFPLAGSTPFSINDLNNDNTNNLVVGDKNTLYMYNIK